MLWIFFLIAIFIMLQKNTFGQKNFKFHAQVPFWQFFNYAKVALLNPCMKFENFFDQKHSFEVLWKWQLEKIFITCPRVCQIQDLCRKKYKKGIFSEVQWWKKFSTHFSDSTHQECMIFARIGNGPCYHHWTEIFAGVYDLSTVAAHLRAAALSCFSYSEFGY